jgi:rod shape determining protein RodA
MPTDFVRHLRQASSGIYRGSRWERFHLDFILIVLLSILVVVGLFVLHSASDGSEHYLKRQVFFYLLGSCVMVAAAQLSPRFIERWAVVSYVLGILVLLAVLLFGTGAKGAQRWLEIGGFRFQPSEIMKSAVPLMLAAYLSRRSLPPRLKHVLVSILLMAAPAVLVGLQPDLGTAILVFSSGFFALFLSGLGKRYIVSAVLLVMAAGPVFWFFLLHDYQKDRILTLFDSQVDKLGAGWNINQSTTAIGSGGWQGKGWLQGTQSHLDFLPESHTDFIIAVLAEEFGLVGIMVLLGLYLLIMGRCLIIGLRAETMFGRLLVGSLSLTFFVYVLVNMAMVSGLLPVVGVPLPLVSYGGTSIVTLMFGFGVLMAVASQRR